jgi:pimeloyl-ACP methyl ester carboxylesterase
VRRVIRWLLCSVAVLFALGTLGALAVDLSPLGANRPAQSLYAGPFVRVGSTLVAYRAWGRTGSPIVLLGGAAEPSWVWHEVGPRLAAAGHRVLAVDLPPFGYTERNASSTMSGWLGLLHGFERRLRINRPLIVGHSLGAGVAAAEALARPEHVAGIVLLDGDALPFGGGHAWLAHVLVYPWYDAAYRLLTGWDWLVGRTLRNAWGPHPPRFPEATLAQFERPFRVQGTAAALRRLVAHGLPGVPFVALAKIRTARAVVWGSDDTVDAMTSGQATATALRVRLQVITGTGHLPMLSQPKAVARRVLELCASPGVEKALEPRSLTAPSHLFGSLRTNRKLQATRSAGLSR